MTAIAVVVGLTVTGLLMWWSSGRDAAADRERLARAGELLSHEAEHQFAHVSAQLAAAAGLFHANAVVPPDGFSTFVDDLDLIPGVVGLGYAQVVAGEHLDTWLADAQRLQPDLTVHVLGGEAPPSGGSALRFPVRYFEPADSRLVGLELGSLPAWNEQLIERLPTEPMVATGLLDAGYPSPLGGPGHVLLARPILDPATPSMHHFVLAVVDLPGLLDESSSSGITDGFAWSLEEATGTDIAAGSHPELWVAAIDFGGRTWLLEVGEAGGGRFRLRGTTLFTLIIGLAITGLVGLVVFLVIGRIEARSEVEVLESISSGKDDFLAAVSHRLRTPLTSVVGFSEVLRDSGGMLSDEDRRQLVSTIAVQAIELGHLFDNLLTVTRESERSPFVSARINLETETQTVLDTAEPERRAKIRIVASEHDAIAAGDPALVRQILRNLLTNATDFGDRVEIEVAKSGIVARVSVRDNGPGIPPDRVADAFVLYGSRGDVGQPDSMGVGLYVSRRLARRMSGDLVYRRSGGWTVFELTLPALPPTVVVPPEAATLPAATP